ncbi:uracil-DNA glycosylase [Ignatzschineria sp. RMDPL8A]|uniref:uracil-DNA glycosylase n=1 Tax=Ignatzschineria sp. RMDPL8A TaxID=2999236 RepID=UPI0024467D1F|nr:uracil-DNA glycosylase [Ignatzschineria sp. RMDPL8A]MDG9730266.1 uracil-DNA glycosylase [Ignatzschineria sp. RMDPL8A]
MPDYLAEQSEMDEMDEIEMTPYDPLEQYRYLNAMGIPLWYGREEAETLAVEYREMRQSAKQLQDPYGQYGEHGQLGESQGSSYSPSESRGAPQSVRAIMASLGNNEPAVEPSALSSQSQSNAQPQYSIAEQMKVEIGKAHVLSNQVIEEGDDSVVTVSLEALIDPPKRFILPPKENLSDLEQAIHDCTACELHLTRPQPVVGFGSGEGGVFIITDAPLRSEAVAGEVIIKQDRAFFAKLFSAIDLPLESLYITPFVKCMPAQLSPVSEGEKERCQTHLIAELETINPQVIVLVGRDVARNLLSKEIPYDQLASRPQALELGGKQYPTYLLSRPELISQNIRLKAASWRQLKRIKGALA